MSNAMIIRGGRIVDPSQKMDQIADVLIEDEKIIAVGALLAAPSGVLEINAHGMIVTPGLIDLHTHLREPGFEYKETIETGVAAAIAGGFTTICCMPNTHPVNDNGSVTELILEKARKAGKANILPVGAITRGLKGEELSEIYDLVSAGCAAISDDGMPVMNSLIMRRALEYAEIFDIPVIDHCEDLNLTDGGVMFEGAISTALGLKGIPAASESVMVARDLALAALTGGRIHLAHISTAASVHLIREAKHRGILVTAETCPHYFTLTDEAVNGYNTNAKMKPPLPQAIDLLEVRAGLADGTIDAIATDHAPHAPWEKEQEMDRAPFGIIGLETAIPLSLRLVSGGVLSLSEMIQKLTQGPAQILRREIGRIRVGDCADITMIDPNLEWTAQGESFKSKSKNSPFIGWKMKGKAVTVIVSGKVIANG
ncbi:MAG: dihydroorotase [Nitrospirae bacterium]|nr:dihydroorotase [Candidatus Troglogloeales bacterium]